ncbi:MFS general substrate transporter [Daedalea quercina L-15889]|uniref:MFS general substrate transporter n=1 Tax=Daedalea quercina L-15889 TaxID=1314783 RepID=A0A165SH78_9APHY|nr:MFS general substrate transporter [Daedalea quercina L-15889]
MAPEPTIVAVDQLELDMTAVETRSDSSSDYDPLLPPEHRQWVPPRANPLPKLQLAVVYFIKLVIPISGTQSMPYMNVFVADLAKSAGAQTGYYSGLVGSASSIAHILTIYLWGRLSDRHGRKPVVIIGTTLTGIFTILFGLSKSFPAVLLTVFLRSFFSGTTGAIHSIVGELVDSTNAATAFPLYDIVSAVGFAAGPLIGGTFSDPATQIGGPWFDTPFWRTYPYLLPCLITAAIAAVALFLAFFVLEETLPAKRGPRKGAIRIQPDEERVLSPVRAPPIDALAQAKPLSVWSLLSTPVMRMVCASSGALAYVAGSWTSVFVLQAYSPVEDGGLALSPSQIGRALGVMGTLSIFLKLGMPFFLRRFGTLTVFRWSMRSWAATFAAMALLPIVARAVHGAEGVAAEWAAVSVVLFLSRIGCMSFSIIMILTRDHTPGTASLGTANGLAEFAQSFAGVFAPAIVSSLFAWSASHHILGGQFWVVVMILVALLSGYFAEQLRKHRDD